MERAALTAAVLLAVVALYLLMLKGWRARLRRQSDLPAPATPPDTPGRTLVPATPGLFVGTTSADDWLDRIAVHDLAHRSAGWIRLDTSGVHVEREGLPDLYLPYGDIERAVLGDALAGKFVGADGMLLLDWRLGERRLTSGFRADDHTAHRRLADALNASLPVRPPSPQPDASPSPDREVLP